MNSLSDTKKKPVTILFFVDGLVAGGKERRLVELMKGLALHDSVRFELVLMNPEVHYQEVFGLGIKLHYIIRRFKRDPNAFLQFFRICQKVKPDFVHCWDGMTAILSTPVCKVLNIKLINGMITDSPDRSKVFYKPFLRARLTFPFSYLIVGNSKAGLASYRAPEHKSTVIYNGFDFERLSALKAKEEVLESLDVKTRYIVGMVATFGIFKDYKTYFSAAEKVLRKRDDVTFLAIGEQTDSEAAKSLVDKEYSNNIRLVGKRSDIESYVNVMDVCVLSTFTEGISNSIIEYMALKKPVVVTKGGGSDEIVENGITGFLVEKSNPDDLSIRVEQLLDDEHQRDALGAAGKEKIRQKFTINQMVTEYLKYYCSVNNK